jgi:hypothetical protein
VGIYIHTIEQEADIFAKPLGRIRFQSLKDRVGVHDVEQFSSALQGASSPKAT